MAGHETCRPAGRSSETSDEPLPAILKIQTSQMLNIKFTWASSLMLLRLQFVVRRALARAFQAAKMPPPRVDPRIV